jgi:hypothetical protein
MVNGIRFTRQRFSDDDFCKGFILEVRTEQVARLANHDAGVVIRQGRNVQLLRYYRMARNR